MDAMTEFFKIGKLLKQLNAITISLIPKIPNPVGPSDFRPIACSNVLYKGISKVICGRLNNVLPSIICFYYLQQSECFYQRDVYCAQYHDLIGHNQDVQ